MQFGIVDRVGDADGSGRNGRQDDDEAHADVAEQVCVEIRAEAALPVVITPLAAWRCRQGRVEGVADEELARDDGVDGAVQLAADGTKRESWLCKDHWNQLIVNILIGLFIGIERVVGRVCLE